MARKAGKRKTRFRKNRQSTSRERPERFLTGTEDDWEQEEGFEANERIVPEGAEDRKAVSRDEALDSVSKTHDLPEGRIIEIQGTWSTVDLPDQRLRCQLRGKFKELAVDQRSVIAVGDRVKVDVQQDGTGLILEILPRSNEVARISYTHNKLAHVIAANVDLLVVVSSVQGPPLWPGLIDRYLVVAHHQKMEPLIAINKVELDSIGEAARCVEEYAALGYQGILLSALTGIGMDEFKDRLRRKTAAFVGQSGVGKSSLLNTLEPEFDLETGEISHATNKGRHVTNSARLLPLGIGGYVVDTPGVRTFDPHNLYLGEVEAGFPEIAARAADCKFQNCEHNSEPKCAVKDAVEDGTIMERRYRSFRSIVE